MSKVIWLVTMSLLGFIAGPNNAMDWVFAYIPLDSPAIRPTSTSAPSNSFAAYTDAREKCRDSVRQSDSGVALAFRTC
jgi:hypothetical protein